MYSRVELLLTGVERPIGALGTLAAQRSIIFTSYERTTMYHSLSIVCVLMFIQYSPICAAEWAKDLFQGTQTTYDFGTVARGADVIHRFQFKNCFKEDIRIVNVRSTCNCTLPSIDTAQDSRTLKTGDVGSIIARLNTPAFIGYRSATLTVTFEFTNSKGIGAIDEVQLQVRGNIQDKLLLEPKIVQFNNVSQGMIHQRRALITHYGATSWRILDVDNSSKYIEVDCSEKYRGRNYVSYELLVRLKKDVPTGYFREPIVLKTNASLSKGIVLDVEGQIVSHISASPSHLSLGDVGQGRCVHGKFIVYGTTPFKIINITCQDNRFSFQINKKVTKTHTVKVTFSGKGSLGKVAQDIQIRTDHGTSQLTAYTNIIRDNTSVLSDQTVVTQSSSPGVLPIFLRAYMVIR